MDERDGSAYSRAPQVEDLVRIVARIIRGMLSRVLRLRDPHLDHEGTRHLYGGAGDPLTFAAVPTTLALAALRHQ